MHQLYPWLGDLHEAGLPEEWIGLICILVSVLCGAVIGMERERRDKPAGLRTLVLIAVGSTIFTMVSLLLSRQKDIADPARLAAQIIPGIGFLGAGAIIHARGTVLGLTTGATIWAVAAVGVTIGSGYVMAGLCFTVVIYLTLTLLRCLERVVVGPCRLRSAAIVYEIDGGKAWPRIQEILDRYEIPDSRVTRASRGDEEGTLEMPVCLSHREHRAILKDLVDIPQVLRVDMGVG
jgi:putative Mg2+ transporter-C (MgtC) family protein